MDADSETILWILFAVLLFGGLDWCFKAFLNARDFTRRFLAAHAWAYRLAGCLAFLTGAGITLVLAVGEGKGFILASLTSGLIVALVALPAWFLAILLTGLFYRTFIAPTLEVGGYLLRPFRTAARKASDPVRRKAEAARHEQDRTERDRAAAARKREQKRRENARARCEVLFHRHAPDIGTRFTRDMFDDYVRKYMGDGAEPDEVEARAGMLEGLLLDHAERVRPSPKFRSLEAIARWFEEQKNQLAQVPDDRLRQALLAKLKVRYTELTTAFLEEMQA